MAGFDIAGLGQGCALYRTPPMGQFFDTGEFSDVSVVCGEHEFHVHKIVLLSFESRFFSAALRGSFVEAHTSRIEIKDEEPATVAGMLYWFYRGHIPEPHRYPCKLKASTDFARHHVLIYAIACKFGIPDLQNRVVNEFKRRYQWKAPKHDRQKTSIWHIDQAWAEGLVRSVYETTTVIEKYLRDIVVIDILEEKRVNPAFSCKIAKLLKSLPELALDVATCYVHTDMIELEPCEDALDEGVRIVEGHSWLIRPCETESEICRKDHRREPSTSLNTSS